MNPRLRIEVGMQVDSEYEVPPKSKTHAVWLGRGGFCHIRIADHQLSRRHCRFSFDDGRLYVEDLGSRNGTNVNGKRISGIIELQHNDRVTVGANVLVVVWPETTRDLKAALAKLGTEEEIHDAYQEVAALQGHEFAGYRIRKEVFNGVTSVVFQARELTHDILAAVKVLKPLAKLTPEDRDHFIAGARYGASLRHPSFVRVFKGGQARGLYFVAMEFMRGRTVETMVEEKSGPLDVRLSLAIIRQVLDGLQHAHQNELVFGGVYADNVIIGDRLRVKIVDFDLAQPVKTGHEYKQTEGGSLARSLHVHRAFASPEQIAYPRMADPKSDVFSAGALLYYMLCGRPPFDLALPGTKPSSAFDRQVSPPRAVNAAVPDSIGAVVVQAMSEYSRFNTAEEMRHALDEAARIARV